MNSQITPAYYNLSGPAVAINLNITSHQLKEVITLLMNQHVDFTINYAPMEAADFDGEIPSNNMITVEESCSLSAKKGKLPDAKYVALVRAVYKEYFIDNIEKMLPSLTEIAVKYEIPPLTLKNTFKKIYDKPFYQLYIEKRMEYAAKLLKDGYGASGVSERLGYSHPIKFNKMFQKYYGITPKKFQMQF